jgi:uncharacterized protein (UPF0332 family)
MKTIHSDRNVERAHHSLVKAYDTLEEARILSKTGKTRLGAYNRLYYTAHHAAVALLRLSGNNSTSHKAIISNLGKIWIRNKKLPKSYGKLLRSLFDERKKADYDEYVPSLEIDINKRLRMVERFLKRVSKEIPAISLAKILNILVHMNPSIRDFSFDFYCPKSYKHHTRVTIWVPKGRITDSWIERIINAQRRALKGLGISESTKYVLGLNSKVNQYADKHILMLDFDNASTIPSHKLKGERGFIFRTDCGFHFMGSILYDKKQWQRKMQKYASISSRDHCSLSLARGYATLRISSSPIKPFRPAYFGSKK